MTDTELHGEPIETDGVLRPTHVEVRLDRISDNYAAIRRHVGSAQVMPILKANAYGHGLIPVAKRLEAEGAPYLGLAYLEEALKVRRSGVQTPILVLGGIIGSQVPLFIEHDLTLTASSVDKLRSIQAAASAMGKRARVHLKIDTGMERIGVHWYSAEKLLNESLRCPDVLVEGIFSHLANADGPDLTHARIQLERFLEVLDFYPRHSLPTPVRHLANSGAVLQLPEAHLDMVRPGILLYGVLPDAGLSDVVGVRPSLTWVSRVVYFKVVQPGNPIGYGSTYSPDAMTRVITVPVGYGDGYFRRLSGRAEVVVRGQRFPIVGRICMDQVMVDIGLKSAWNGDRVVLLGEAESGGVTAQELAEWADTIPYEVLTNINTRVPRVYIG